MLIFEGCEWALNPEKTDRTNKEKWKGDLKILIMK